MARDSISACIITLNEGKNLEACIKSVSWCDEIIVVDCGSTDETLDIARRYDARIFSQEWLGYREQKKFAFSKATGDWILEIDADERLDEQLKQEILHMLEHGTEHAGFTVNMKHIYMGRWLTNRMFYPDPHLRLFRRTKGRLVGPLVHHYVDVDGTIGKMNGHLIHLAYPSISHHIQKISKQVRTETEDYWKQGVMKFSLLRLLLHPVYRFLQMYFIKGGYKDGLEGFFASAGFSFGTFARYVYLYELEQKNKR